MISVVEVGPDCISKQSPCESEEDRTVISPADYKRMSVLLDIMMKKVSVQGNKRKPFNSAL